MVGLGNNVTLKKVNMLNLTKLATCHPLPSLPIHPRMGIPAPGGSKGLHYSQLRPEICKGELSTGKKRQVSACNSSSPLCQSCFYGALPGLRPYISCVFRGRLGALPLSYTVLHLNFRHILD